MEVTKEGLEKLHKELDELKNIRRKELSERLRKAIAFGDLSENFDYHNAKEEQEFLERRIAELEDMIADSKIMITSQAIDVVRLGLTVTVESLGEKFSFAITDPNLANPLENKISVDSPIGQALFGKKKGDFVDVETPNGKIQYKILKIE